MSIVAAYGWQLLTSDRWNYLQAGISRVMNDLERGIDMQMYMGVYTYVQVGCIVANVHANLTQRRS